MPVKTKKNGSGALRQGIPLSWLHGNEKGFHGPGGAEAACRGRSRRRARRPLQDEARGGTRAPRIEMHAPAPPCALTLQGFACRTVRASQVGVVISCQPQPASSGRPNEPPSRPPAHSTQSRWAVMKWPFPEPGHPLRWRTMSLMARSCCSTASSNPALPKRATSPTFTPFRPSAPPPCQNQRGNQHGHPPAASPSALPRPAIGGSSLHGAAGWARPRARQCPVTSLLFS